MNRIYEVCIHCMNEPVERKQPIDDKEGVNYCPECGRKMTIIHIYEMCPCCMDELFEREQEFDDQDSVNYCPKCGHKLVWALLGDKIDDTTYKILLNDAFLTNYMDRRKKFLDKLMKMGNITFGEALEKYKTKNCVIFEGNVRDTFINMDLLDGFTPEIHYTVIPEFPFVRFAAPFTSICPTCGGDVVDREGGTFCEKCNEWVLLPPL